MIALYMQFGEHARCFFHYYHMRARQSSYISERTNAILTAIDWGFFSDARRLPPRTHELLLFASVSMTSGMNIKVGA
jgi:hypothetical protein